MGEGPQSDAVLAKLALESFRGGISKLSDSVQTQPLQCLLHARADAPQLLHRQRAQEAFHLFGGDL